MIEKKISVCFHLHQGQAYGGARIRDAVTASAAKTRKVYAIRDHQPTFLHRCSLTSSSIRSPSSLLSSPAPSSAVPALAEAGPLRCARRLAKDRRVSPAAEHTAEAARKAPHIPKPQVGDSLRDTARESSGASEAPEIARSGAKPYLENDQPNMERDSKRKVTIVEIEKEVLG